MADAFSPIPLTQAQINVSSTSQRVALPARAGGEVRVMNDGTGTVWLAFGDSSVTVSTTNGVPIGSGGTEVFEVPADLTGQLHVAAIGTGATGTIYFNPGEGL